ncbi:MAG: LptE family protein [Bacteroidetes bacterium]|nr:LptE family protein [Bacteroidota bacterium]
MKKLAYIFILIVSLFAFNSCKVKYSLDGATIPIEAKTVSVGFFTNNTTLGSPSISQKFTEKLRDVVSSQTRLSLMKQNGDLKFEGTIVDYNNAPVAIQSNDQAANNRLTITVNVKYTNRFDETKNFEQNFTRFSDYPANSAISSVEDALLTEINRQLTEDIFNKAFNNW